MKSISERKEKIPLNKKKGDFRQGIAGMCFLILEPILKLF